MLVLPLLSADMIPAMWSEHPVELPWRMDPIEAVRRWPRERQLLMLHSGRFDARWSRFTVLAEADAAFRFHNGRSEWMGWGAPKLDWSNDPLTDLGDALNAMAPLWIGHIGYDVGRYIEKLPSTAREDRSWPVVQFHRCPGWLVYDAESGAWWANGAWASAMRNQMPQLDKLHSRRSGYQAGEPQPLMPRDAYEQMVARGIEYIAAGDVFQVNLAQRFSAEFDGDARALYARLTEAAPPWYGAYLELMHEDPSEPRRVVLSASPELFLQLTSDGRVVTRPIKGTRPASADVDELVQSKKDQAELHMIVDLLRNDLGKVCRWGSVKVDEARVIESHPTVHHGVATVSGELKNGATLVDLLRATMPGGSVTGAPKVRAMQIIEELEPVRRGPYCGAIGWVRDKDAGLSMTIRTMLMELEPQKPGSPGAAPGFGKGWLDYHVGAGIVGDSKPASEYEETLDKAAAILTALRGEADGARGAR